MDGSLSQSERRTLKGLYTTGPAAYGSVASLVKASSLSKKKVKEFLHGNNAYTQYHIAYKKFKRLNIVAKSVDEIWCMDLAQVDKLSSQNDDVNYLLVSVDVLSRFVRVQTQKNKEAITTKNAFMKMMEVAHVQPKFVWVDEGKEFLGAFGTLCRNMGITVYSTHSKKKAAFAERGIRSLKNILYRYMADMSTDRYVHKLQSFVKTMNSRENRSIKMAPKDVTNRDALKIIQLSAPSKRYRPSFIVGDYVRVVKDDTPFRKGYKPQFTRDIHTIHKVATTNPVTYILRDKEKKILRGKFYEKQLIHYAI